MKEDRTKTIQLLHAVHAGRGVDKDVFAHEICEYPPSLTKNDLMHIGNKSDILECIGANVDVGEQAIQRHVQAIVIDGPVLVQLVRPQQSVTFQEYIHRDIFSYLQSHLSKPDIKRVDIGLGYLAQRMELDEEQDNNVSE